MGLDSHKELVVSDEQDSLLTLKPDASQTGTSFSEQLQERCFGEAGTLLGEPAGWERP